MSEKYLDFNVISKIKFLDLLNWKNIPYTLKGGEAKGQIKDIKFIINLEKNIFFSPDDDKFKGSVINFLASAEGMDLRQAAKELKSYFLEDVAEPKREIPELELVYTKSLADLGISEEICKRYEVGFVKQRSIMQGRIAFKIYNEIGEVAGYVGWHPIKNHWLFPKNFKRPLYNFCKVDLQQAVVLTSNLFDCLCLLSHGITQCTSLIARSMTDKQEELLNKFEKIILIHPEPDNIILRLSKCSFIKAPPIKGLLKDYTDEEIMTFISRNLLSPCPG